MGMKRGKTGISEKYERFASYDESPREMVLNDLSGGVSLGEAGTGAISHMMNMEPAGKRLFSMGASHEEQPEGGFSEGVVRNHCFANGIWLFRKGRSLYARVDDTILLVGTENMLEKEYGGIYHLGESFYLVDGMRILKIEKDLSYSEVEQQVPICYIDVSRDAFMRTEAAKPVIFQEYFDIVLSEEALYYQYLPQDIAYDRTFIEVYKSEEPLEILSPSKYRFENTVIKFDVIPSGYRVRLKLVESSDPNKLSLSTYDTMRDFFDSSNTLIPYTDAEGLPFFVTWHGEEVWLIRRTADLFSCISDDVITHFSMGEAVTAVIPYEDGFFVFTENVVKKLYFMKDELGVISAVTSIFKQDFGSDMPKSICGFDDKIIFASSRGGVFYINKFGITEKDMSRKISANIEDGDLGFFSHTPEEFHEASGVCAFGKYLLSLGGTTYIWDYSEKLPTGTASLQNEQGMVWTLSDRTSGAEFLQELWGRLYYWDRETETLRYLTGKREDARGLSYFQTAESDLGTANKKVLLSFGMRYRAAESVTVRLFFDGEALPVIYTFPAHEKSVMETVRLYARHFEKVSVRVSSEGAMVAELIFFQYI